MSIIGGTYDAECEVLARQLHSECVLLFVAGGTRGTSWSLVLGPIARQAPAAVTQAAVDALEEVLRQARAELALLRTPRPEVEL